MKRTLLAVAALAAACALAVVAEPASNRLTDVLERPAMQSPVAAKKLLNSVVRAGERLVAVGPRGHIVVSKDAGATWQQAKVPLSSDLTAVHFPSEKHGWAVGHDGVVLATTDGGLSWVKQLDGRVVNDLILADLQVKLATSPESTELQALVAEAERYKSQGPDKPLLDVWFEDDAHGFAVGAYGLMLETSDGGQTWQSWFDRAENPRFMNLYSIRPAAGSVYVSGEGGTVLRLDPVARRFTAVPVDYAGSLFGVVDAGDAVLVFGLRGNAFRSTDGGANWSKVDSRLPATIVSGLRNADGEIILADQGGRIAVSHDGGATFDLIPRQRTLPLTSIADAGEDRLAATGPFGAMVVAPDAPR